MKRVFQTAGLFVIVFLIISGVLFINMKFFTPMPENDADLAAWGMRYALIPSVAFLYTTLIFFLTAFVKIIQIIRNRSTSRANES